jgi:peptidoglycan/xylan/chitin deacetylase (PgdA/CDA1 family)
MFKRKWLIIACAAILAAAIGVSDFCSRNYTVPILMYHSVHAGADGVNPLVISPDVFERQMGFLTRHHYNVVSLEDLARLIQSRAKIPSRTVAITLDDGYKDVFTDAFPILQKYRVPATAFVIINEIGRREGDRLSWDDVLAMQRSGLVTIGSHTLGPGLLTEYTSPDEVKWQLSESKRILQERLGVPVYTFSYPEGRFNATIRQDVIDAGYKVAVATHPGRDYPKNDVFALKRLRISQNCGTMFVFWFETSGIYTFIREQGKHQKKNP